MDTSETHVEAAELLARSRDGDRTAFDVLLAPHRRDLQTFCSRLGGDPALVERLLLDVLAAAWQHLDRVRDPDRLGVWLLGIAHNAGIRALGLERPPPLDRSDAGDEMQANLGRVPPDFRAAFLLHDLCALSYDDIAGIQAVSPEVVRSRVAKARTAIQQLAA